MEATHITEEQPVEPQCVRVEGVDGLAFPFDPDCRYLIVVPNGYKVSCESAATITEKLKEIGVGVVLIAGDAGIKIFELERGR